jgi:hypothetical protein
MARYFLFIAIYMVFSLDILAQSIDPVPWPPETPEMLFGSTIEIVNMQLGSTAIQRANPITVSPEHRAVFTHDGKIYAWPEEFPFYAGHVYVPNRVFLSASSHPGGEIDEYWLLDLTSGSYTRLNQLPERVESLCGPFTLESVNRIEWIFVTGVNSQIHACNLATGRVTPPLPEGFIDWQVVSTSAPDHLLLSAEEEGVADGFNLFAYSLSKDEIFLLGVFIFSERNTVSVLHNELSLLLQTSFNRPDGSAVNSTFLVDLEARSIQQIPNSSYSDNPPHLTSWEQIETENGSTWHITVTYLDSGETFTYTFDPSCNPRDSYADDHNYYCRVLNSGRDQVDVLNVDVLTGKTTVLYSGEVEKISWVSDDQRYAALIIDNNGIIDTLPGTVVRVHASGDEQFVVLDLEDQNILFETQAYPGGIAETWMPIAYEVREGWLAVAGGSSVYLLHFEEDGVSISSVKGSYISEIGNYWAALYPAERINEYGAIAQFSLYNLQTQQEIPVVSLYGRREYYLPQGFFQHLGDGIFQVTIGFAYDVFSDEVPPAYDLAVYDILIPGVDIE